MLFDFYDDFINKQWQSHINKIWFKNQYIKKPHWYSCAMLLTPRCGRRRWARSWLLWCPSRSRSRAWKRRGAGWSPGPGSAKGATAETGSTTNAALYQLHSRLSTGRMLEWKSRWALRELTKRFGRCGMQERRVACEPWAPRWEWNVQVEDVQGWGQTLWQISSPDPNHQVISSFFLAPTSRFTPSSNKFKLYFVQKVP